MLHMYVIYREEEKTHILSSKEDKTTETDEAAIAAEPIQG